MQNISRFHLTKSEFSDFSSEFLFLKPFDWCCFYYFVRNSLVALLKALCAQITVFIPRGCGVDIPLCNLQPTNVSCKNLNDSFRTRNLKREVPEVEVYLNAENLKDNSAEMNLYISRDYWIYFGITWRSSNNCESRVFLGANLILRPASQLHRKPSNPKLNLSSVLTAQQFQCSSLLYSRVFSDHLFSTPLGRAPSSQVVKKNPYTRGTQNLKSPSIWCILKQYWIFTNNSRTKCKAFVINIGSNWQFFIVKSHLKWFLGFGLLCSHTASSPITAGTHTSGAQ